MLPATQRYVARGDIWNEAWPFITFPDKTETERRSNFESSELFNYSDMYYIEIKHLEASDIAGKSNGKLPPSTCPGCTVPEPYRSHEWALVPANPASKAEY